MSYQDADLDRRLGALVQIGVVVALDEGNGLAKVDLGGPETTSIPWATVRAGGDRTWWAPEVGEQVVVLAPSGELVNAFIAGSLFQDLHPQPASSIDTHRTEYADGTVIEYDRGAHRLLADLGSTKITATRDALVLESNGSSITLSADGIVINGTRVDIN